MPEKMEENYSGLDKVLRLILETHLIIPECHTNWLLIIGPPHDCQDTADGENGCFESAHNEAHGGQAGKILGCCCAEHKDPPSQYCYTEELGDGQALNQKS